MIYASSSLLHVIRMTCIKNKHPWSACHPKPTCLLIVMYIMSPVNINGLYTIFCPVYICPIHYSITLIQVLYTILHAYVVKYILPTLILFGVIITIFCPYI